MASSLPIPSSFIPERNSSAVFSARSFLVFSMSPASSVTYLPFVRCEYTSPSLSSSPYAFSIVFGLTAASTARSLTVGSLSPGAYFQIPWHQTTSVNYLWSPVILYYWNSTIIHQTCQIFFLKNVTRDEILPSYSAEGHKTRH